MQFTIRHHLFVRLQNIGDMIQFLAVLLAPVSIGEAIMVDYGVNDVNYGNGYSYSSMVGPLAANLGLYYYGDGQEDYQDYYPYTRYALNYGVHDPYDGDIRSSLEIRDGNVLSTYNGNGPAENVVEYATDEHNGFDANAKRYGDPIHSAPAPLGRYISVTPEYYGYEKHY